MSSFICYLITLVQYKFQWQGGVFINQKSCKIYENACENLCIVTFFKLSIGPDWSLCPTKSGARVCLTSLHHMNKSTEHVFSPIGVGLQLFTERLDY